MDVARTIASDSFTYSSEGVLCECVHKRRPVVHTLGHHNIDIGFNIVRKALLSYLYLYICIYLWFHLYDHVLMLLVSAWSVLRGGKGNAAILHPTGLKELWGLLLI